MLLFFDRRLTGGAHKGRIGGGSTGSRAGVRRPTFQLQLRPPCNRVASPLVCCPLTCSLAKGAQASCQCCQERPRLAVQGSLCAPRKRGAQLHGGSPVPGAVHTNNSCPCRVFPGPGEAQQPDDPYLAVAFALPCTSNCCIPPAAIKPHCTDSGQQTQACACCSAVLRNWASHRQN